MYKELTQANIDFNQLMISSVIQTKTKKLLDAKLKYNAMLYKIHYQYHLEQIESMYAIGDITAIRGFSK